MAAPLPKSPPSCAMCCAIRELELTPTTRFDDMTGWDSMDLITVVVEVECRFDLQFELPEIDRLTTVGDLLRMIEAKQALAAA